MFKQRTTPSKFSTKVLSAIYATSVGIVFGFSSVASADDFDLRISDDALHANLSIDVDASELSYGGGYFYKDEDDDSINVVNIDLHSKGQTAIVNYPTTIRIGVQANYLDAGEVSSTAIGVGGSARVNLPDTPGLSLESELHFAPDVLTFGDSKRFTRFRLQANYRIIRTADVSAGYRYLATSLDDGGSTTLESGLFIGMKLNF